MSARSLILIACLGIYPMQEGKAFGRQFITQNSISSVRMLRPYRLKLPLTEQERSTAELQQLARSIAVKVRSGNNWGSGILIHRQGQIYTVVTNRHVLTAGDGKGYRIQTFDDRIYPANVPARVQFEGKDLAILQFRSANISYQLAELETSSTLAVGDEVFAAGFPFEINPSLSTGGNSSETSLLGEGGFFFTIGQVSLLIDRSFGGGYQIGYTNNIQKGMSGGPLLNRQGKVVGINGMHSYPLWGNPYIFEDGSVANATAQEEMSQLSWAVPVQTFLQLAPQFSAVGVRRSRPTLSPVIVDPKLPRILPQPGLLW